MIKCKFNLNTMDSYRCKAREPTSVIERQLETAVASKGHLEAGSQQSTIADVMTRVKLTT